MIAIVKTASTALKAVLCMAGLIWGLSSAQAADDEMPKVMMFGVFHFANPGKDMVKTDQINVMTDKPQAYLDRLAQRIVTEFKPTKILLEYSPSGEEVWQDRYQKYLDGTYELPSNENYQLGFRIGKAAGGIPVRGYDEQEIGWEADAMFEVMPVAAPALQAEVERMIGEISQETAEAHRTKSLGELLLDANDPEKDRLNKSFYIMTNGVSADGKFQGATASASWWHRNFRMYARIQQNAAPGERLLVIGGQGHTAILKDFLAMDSHMDGLDIRPLLLDAEQSAP